MTRLSDELMAARHRGARLCATVGWLLVPVPAFVAWIAGNGGPAFAVAAILIAICGEAACRTGGSSARFGTAQALVAQAALFTAALAGHPWQLDSHMLYFALLAVMVVMIDRAAILAAAAAIAVHHVSLSLFWPAMLYPGTDLLANVERALLHGVVVAVESAALVYAVSTRHKLDIEAMERAAHLDEALRRADEEQQAALAASKRAERESARAEAARQDAETALARQQDEAARARRADEKAAAAADRESEERQGQSARQAQVVDGLRAGLNRLASGDLSVELKEPFSAEYEDLRSDFNRAARSLSGAIAQVSRSVTTLASEVDEISGAAQSLASRTEKQAATLEGISTRVDGLTQSIGGASENALAMRDEVLSTHRDAEGSVKVMSSAVDSMEGIEAASGRINKITEVIEGIAFQTNLLALNAGVEAARAGEAGRGFAVVAAEVRGLAQRSSEAAAEISQLIASSNVQVKEGARLVRETGRALEHIQTAISRVAERIHTISDSATSQSDSLNDINRSISDLDTFTQKNAALFEETSAASEVLKTSARDLKRATDRFSTAEAGPQPKRRAATAVA